MRDAYFTTLGTLSSASTIPVTPASTKKNGVSDSVADLVVALCAAIHLSASMVKITCFWIAVLLLTGGDISFGAYLQFILMPGVMVIAAPGLPAARSRQHRRSPDGELHARPGRRKPLHPDPLSEGLDFDVGRHHGRPRVLLLQRPRLKRAAVLS